MGPNEFRVQGAAKPDNNFNPQGQRPIQRQQPMGPTKQQAQFSDFGPRPAQNFRSQPANAPGPGLRPAASQAGAVRTANDFAPRPAAFSMPQQANPAAQPAPRAQYQNPTEEYITLNAQQVAQNQAPKKARMSKTKKLLLAAPALLLVVAGGFALSTNDHGAPKTTKAHATSVPLVPPEFSVFFPKSLPSGLSTSKGSITYTKSSFTFIIKQGGQNQFFVYERPASSDPDFASLKTTLIAPKSITLTVGPGISGGLNTGTVTAIKIENTMVMINSLNTNNDDAAKNILANMQVTNDLNSLRQSY
jgi:hypothetical protein